MAATSSGCVANEDAALHYEVYGTITPGQPPLIMLHGNAEDLHYFDTNIEVLSKTQRVIAVDARGRGSSAFGDRPLDFELLADDLFAVMNRLQIGTAVILGFSDGANTAIQFALTHPERVAALILVGANLSPEGLKPSVRSSIQTHYRIEGVKAKFNDKSMRKREIIGLMANHPHIDPTRLKTIRVPVLVIAGEDDMIKQEHTELIANSFRDAELVVIKGGKHFIPSEMPEKFNELVLEFLS